MTTFTPNGLIGKSGKFYPCGVGSHSYYENLHKHDAPFVALRSHIGVVDACFDAYYTSIKETPTKAQFETLMDWCTATGNIFEDVTDCWDLPWARWREMKGIDHVCR